MKTCGFDIGNKQGALFSMEGGSFHMCMSTANSIAGMPTTAFIEKNGAILIADRNLRNNAFKVEAVKRCMQAGRDIVRTNGKETRRAVSDDIYTEIVRALLRQGQDELSTIADDGKEGNSFGSVICYPSAFSDEPEILDRMTRAAEKADPRIRVLGIIPESGAASLAYLYMIRERAMAERGKVPDNVTIALLDIGGGTTDAAVVRATVQETPYELLLHDGISDFGGKDIDDIFYEDTLMSLGGVFRDNPPGPAEKEMLRDQVIRGKEALSDQPTYTITMNVGNYGEVYEHILTRERLEALSRGGILRAVELLEKMLDRAAAENIKIDMIVLTGGVSRMPLVSECVKELVRQKKAVSASGQELGTEIFDPSWAVAKGAAIYAASRKRILEQRTRHNYGFRYEDKDGTERCNLCIPYARTLPAESKPVHMRRIGNRMEVSVAYDENSKDIGIKEGDAVKGEKMKEFRRFYFDESSGDVQLTIDENMTLTVTLRTEDGRVITQATGSKKGERGNG